MSSFLISRSKELRQTAHQPRPETRPLGLLRHRRALQRFHDRHTVDADLSCRTVAADTRAGACPQPRHLGRCHRGARPRLFMMVLEPLGDIARINLGTRVHRYRGENSAYLDQEFSRRLGIPFLRLVVDVGNAEPCRISVRPARCQDYELL